MNQLTEVVDFIATLPPSKRSIDEILDMATFLVSLVPEDERDAFVNEFGDRVKPLVNKEEPVIRTSTPDPDCTDMEDTTLPEDWDLEFPVLRLRKDIWENFPVEVKPLGAGVDGAERHAIVWHRKNLVEWRETRSSSFDEWNNYETCSEYRLMKCLLASPRWTVENPLNSNQICVIRMNYITPVSTTVAVPVVAAAPVEVSQKCVEEWISVRHNTVCNVPMLARLNDIKTHFPVVWHTIPTLNGTIQYALEFHGKKLREMNMTAGRDMTDELRNNLMYALNASTAWRVLRAEHPRELCHIEMA